MQPGAAVTVPCERVPLHVYTFCGESGVKHLFAVTAAAPSVRVGGRAHGGTIKGGSHGRGGNRTK